MAAVLVIVFVLAGIFYCNARAISTLRASRETIQASKILQQCSEQLRMANWVQFSDSAYL